MEHKRFPVLVGCLVAWVLILASGGSASYGTEYHEGPPANGKGGAEAKSVGELWHAIKAREAELSGLVEAKKLGKVHEAAFAVRDLVASMPDKSGQLSADQLGKLGSNVKYVTALANRLDTAGDANDQAATEASFKQLQSVLTAIEALYPEEALK